MPNNFLNPAFAATQKKFAVPRVTGQYEQLPQNGGSGMRQGAWAPWKNPTPGTVSYGYAPGSVPQKYEARLPANMLTQGPATDFDTSGTDPATIAARLARQEASGGRLNFSRGSGNSGNYSMSPSDPGIDAQALVRANPNAIYGFSDAMRGKLSQSKEYQDDLKARQLAYQQRQAGAEQNMLARQQMVQQNAMARGDARRGRIESRNQGPNFFDQMMQQDPETALAAMEVQQRGQALNNQNLLAQGQLQNQAAENQWRMKDAEARLGLTRNDMDMKKQEVAGNMLAAAAAIRDANPDLADQLEQQAMGQIGGQQGQNAMAGPQGAPQGQRRTSPVHEEKLASLKSPREKRDYMRNVMRLPENEITYRLQQDYQPSLAGSMFGAAFGGQRGSPNATMPEGPMIDAPSHTPGIIDSAFNWLIPNPEVGLPPINGKQQRGSKRWMPQ